LGEFGIEFDRGKLLAGFCGIYGECAQRPADKPERDLA
jgi:hypothetical protein